MVEKPIEYRQLYHPSSQVSQGVVKLWVEIYPNAIPTNEIKIWDLTPRPPVPVEIRVVVWDTKGVPAMDVEGTSDIFAKVFFDQKKDGHQTDTHFRCQTGKGSFNYRMIFKKQWPRKDYSLTFQLWDRDIISSNDFIGDCQLNLRDLMTDTAESGKIMNLNKKYYESFLKQHLTLKLDFYDDISFWLPARTRDSQTGKIIERGQVRVSIDCLPQNVADTNPVGKARDAPNHSPFCPPPIGRFQWSMNPFKMFAQLVGPEIRRKVYCACCCIICFSLCLFIFPMMGTQLASNVISRIF